MFMSRGVSVAHRGLGLVVCNMVVTMAGDKWPRRILVITVTLYADKMPLATFAFEQPQEGWPGTEVGRGPKYLY